MFPKTLPIKCSFNHILGKMFIDGDTMKMLEQKRRKHPRCYKPTAITYQFMNKSTKHRAIAQNYNRDGMCFETQKYLVPNSLIVIRSVECSDDIDPEFLPIWCLADNIFSKECKNLKIYVVAEVKKCNLTECASGPVYDVAVIYISPAT